jgi:hypothetical protein
MADVDCDLTFTYLGTIFGICGDLGMDVDGHGCDFERIDRELVLGGDHSFFADS